MSKVSVCIMGIICIMSLSRPYLYLSEHICQYIPNEWRESIRCSNCNHWDSGGASLGDILNKSLNEEEEKLMTKLKKLQDDSLYCISVDNATGCIITSCLGIQCLDNPLKDTYMSIDELPEWVKGKIAVLNMVELIKDTNGQEYTEIVDGVGYRLGNTYYIGPLTS